MAEEGPRPRGRKQPALYLCDFSQSVTKSKVQRDPAMAAALVSILQRATSEVRVGAVFPAPNQWTLHIFITLGSF